MPTTSLSDSDMTLLRHSVETLRGRLLLLRQEVERLDLVVATMTGILPPARQLRGVEMSKTLTSQLYRAAPRHRQHPLNEIPENVRSPPSAPQSD